MSEETARPNPGPDVRLGSYRLLEPLGSGGMSSVFRAVHEGSGAEVAVKVLPRYLAKNPVLLQRFLREAQSAESLDHPNIVSIYDHGTEGGRYYLVLEYVHAADLHDRVKKLGPLSLRQTVEIAEQATDALSYAVSRGLIHRDIKPANLLVDDSGRVKLIDLGLALQSEGEDERVTRDGTTVGTVDYMSPEQARDSRAATQKSDQYSLGCTLHYLLTGLPPYPGGDIADKLRRHAVGPAPDAREHRADVPEELALLIRRMMARNPADRFPDHAAVRQALASLPDSARVDDEPGLDFALLADEDDPHALPDFSLGFASSPIDAVSTLEAAPITRTRQDSSLEDLFPVDLPEVVSKQADARAEPLSMAQLAALVDDEIVPSVRPKPQPQPQPELAEPAGLIEPESIDEPIEAHAPIARPTSDGTSPHAWAIGGAAGGLVVALVVFMFITILRETRPSPIEASEGPVAFADTVKPVRPKPRIDRQPLSKAALPAHVAESDPPRLVVEPALEPEPTFPPEVEAVFAPAPNRFNPPKLDPTITSAGRLDDAALRRALESTSGTIELDDVGPFFATEIKVRGPVRAWRARQGQRAIIAVLSHAPGAAAPIVLEPNTDLTIERLDFIVHPARFAIDQLALFECRAGSTLRLLDCTVTLIGGGASAPRRFSLARFDCSPGEDAPAFQLQRTMVRSATGPLFLAGKGGFTLDVDHSALIASTGSIAQNAGPAELCFRHALVSSAGPVLEGGAEAAWSVRSLDTLFASMSDGGGPICTGPDGSWTAEATLYRGFSSRPHGDVRSEFDPSAPPGSDANPLLATPDSLQSAWPRFATRLARVATPVPYLLQRSLGAFDRERSTEGTDRVASPSGRPVVASNFSGGALVGTESDTRIDERNAERFRNQVRGSGNNPATGAIIRFELDQRGNNDLAAFVNSVVLQTAEPTLTIDVVGAGSGSLRIDLKPIELQGKSLRLRVLPTIRDRVEWRASVEAGGRPLFDVTNGDLSLDGFSIVSTGPVIRVSRGRLELSSCSIQSSGAGTVIQHDSDAVEASRPVVGLRDCVIIGQGEGIALEEVGHTVQLENVAIAAVGAAIRLKCHPSGGRDVFHGELWLDRTTLASESALVKLDAWAGPPADRPFRPWVIFSSRCHFLDDYESRTRSAPVLEVDNLSFQRGGIAWQGDHDVYDVGRFIARQDEAEPRRPQADFRRDWTRIWGENHVIDSVGPTFSGGSAGKRGRLTPGAVTPRQLVSASAVVGGEAGVIPERLGPLKE
jgi:eukaryotic-like serine/threonine-protein kinase